MDEQQDGAARLVAEWWPYEFDAASMVQKRAELEEWVRQLVARSEQNARESLKLAGESYVQGYRDGVQVEREACLAVATEAETRCRAGAEQAKREGARSVAERGYLYAVQAGDIAAAIRARGSE